MSEVTHKHIWLEEYGTAGLIEVFCKTCLMTKDEADEYEDAE